MSLFGLGVPELAVIGVLAAIIFGPKNLAGMGKDLGKIAGSLKAEAATFSEAMNESLAEAEKGMKEVEKEVAKPATAAKPVEAKPTAKKIDLTDE
jgi:sec-independent protein translocase protein TatA